MEWWVHAGEARREQVRQAASILFAAGADIADLLRAARAGQPLMLDPADDALPLPAARYNTDPASEFQAARTELRELGVSNARIADHLGMSQWRPKRHSQVPAWAGRGFVFLWRDLRETGAPAPELLDRGAYGRRGYVWFPAVIARLEREGWDLPALARVAKRSPRSIREYAAGRAHPPYVVGETLVRILRRTVLGADSTARWPRTRAAPPPPRAPSTAIRADDLANPEHPLFRRPPTRP